MKNNYVLTIILTLIVGISIVIFGLSVYRNLTIDNNENNQEQNINFEEVNQLLQNVIDHPISPLQAFEQHPNKTFLNIDEINPDYFSYMLLKSSKLEKAQICGTSHEEILKKMHIISEIGEGQFDCRSDSFYRIDSIKEASKEIFGKVLSQLTIKTNDRNASYFYFENGGIAVIRYSGAWINDYTISDYYIKDSILSIEISSETSDYDYKLNYKEDDENFYFESIHKI